MQLIQHQEIEIQLDSKNAKRSKPRIVYHPIYTFIPSDEDFQTLIDINCSCIMTEIEKFKRNGKKMTYWVDGKSAEKDITNLTLYKINRLSKPIKRRFCIWHGWEKEHGDGMGQMDDFLVFHIVTGDSTDNYTMEQLVHKFIETFGREHVSDYYLKNIS